jgi:arylformamidase
VFVAGLKVFINQDLMFGVAFAVHRALLGKGIPIVEGVMLTDVKPGDYELMLLPMRVVGHEAASARVLIKPR